mgnify:FL=1
MKEVRITEFNRFELDYLADMIHEKLVDMGYDKTLDARHVLDGTFSFDLIVSFEEEND